MVETSIQLSVNQLLDELCRSLYIDKVCNRVATSSWMLESSRPRTVHQYLDHDAMPSKLLRRCKKRAYEILLKKNVVEETNDEGFAESADPIFEIRFSQFEFNLYVGQLRSQFDAYGHLSENLKKRILQKHATFGKCIEAIETDSYFGDEHSDGHVILRLLVLLRRNQIDPMCDDGESIFGLNMKALPELRLNEPKWCRLNWPQTQTERNPYCGENTWRVMNGNYKSSLFATPLNTIPNAFLTKFNGNDGALHLKRTHRMPLQQQQQLSSPERSKPRSTKRISTAIQYTSNKWEQLGERYVLRATDELLEMPFEPKFVSETKESTLHLCAAKSLANHQLFEANIVPTQKFLGHLKLLLVGIESDSFLYNKSSASFRMVDNLTVDDAVLPESIEHFARDFIECGTSYKRLKLITKAKHEGFLFRAMSTSFDKYLETFRRFIIFGNDRTLVDLVLRVTPLIKQLRVLAKVLAIHPDDNEKDIPRGSEFLGYLYRQIIGVTQPDVSALLVFVLTECCDIYFRNFENWIYHGVIDDPCKELFIEFVNHYRPKTKFYFDKAYFIKRQSVPGFLQGWESLILICGKYANLLKLYKPTHPLFSLSPPSMNVCLSFEQLKKLEYACHEYRRQAQTLCGPSLAVADVFKRKAERQREMVNRVAQKCQRDLEQWRVDRDARNNDVRERKENDRLVLLEQIQEIRERKIQKRREQLMAEQEYLQQSEQKEMELVARESAQRQRNIDYYNELGAIVDAQRKRTEDEIHELKKQLKSSAATAATAVNEDDDSTTSLPISDKADGDDSDNDSVYFDAQKSPSTPTSAPSLPRSTSDFLNSNTSESPTDRATTETHSDLQRNRANILSSHIQLAADDRTESITSATAKPEKVTEAQQNKLRMLHQEFHLIDADSNSNDIQVQRTELTDLQRNRNKVLTQEYVTPVASVAVPNASETEFTRNRRIAMHHAGWAAQESSDCNANEVPLTDLQRNRLKVLTHEYNLVDVTSPSSARNRLKASLSLDLDIGNKKDSDSRTPTKMCQSEFFNSPMSTTSDGLLIEHNTTEMSSSLSERSNDKQKFELKLDTESAAQAIHDASTHNAESSRPIDATPYSALNTAGLMHKQNGFVFDRSTLGQPSFSQMIRPTSSATNFFDIAPRLSAVQTPTQPSADSSEATTDDRQMHTSSELRALNVANLTDFLQQSFTIPLQAHLSLLNNEMLKIFFDEFDIIDHFKSLRNYFFMMDGEFASNISDGILTKLHKVRKPNELMNSHVLHSILENALHSSIIGNDKNAENLSFFIPHVPDRFDMSSPNVLKELHLSYKVDWPLNLLLSHETIEHYGNVFQHLLKLRRITWLLDQCFYKLKDIRKQSAEKIQQSSQFRHVQQIRHRLLCFVNALQTHITSVALQGSWQLFQEQLQSVKSMEELYRKHTKYLKRVEFLCMLNKSSQEFYAKMEDIFVVVLRFCYNLQSKNWRCDDHGAYTHPRYEKLLTIENDFVKLIKFIIYVGQKMHQCGYQTEIGEFIHMINMNGYYDNV